MRTVSRPGTLGPHPALVRDVLLDDELTRQADVLVELGYPEQVRAAAKALAGPLRALLGDEVVAEPARASFVLVPGRACSRSPRACRCSGWVTGRAR